MVGINRTYKTNITKQVKGILIGTLLGDGSLSKARAHRILTIEHCIKQKRYLKYKAQKLKDFGGKIYIRKRYDKRTNRRYESHVLISRSHYLLDYLYKEVYKNKKKRANQMILNFLTPEGIAIWYCDDGSIKVSPKGVCLTICTQSFDNASRNLIIKMFKKKYNLNFYHRKDGIITLTSKEEIIKFMNKFGGFIPKCMEYKKVEL